VKSGETCGHKIFKRQGSSTNVTQAFDLQRAFLLRSKYRYTPASTGNTFQDLPRLRETADNTERYIQGVSGGTVNILGGSMDYSE
jgi:hypothetical protein